MMAEAQMAEEKASKAMVDAARLADELRQEQEFAQQYERDRKLLECQCKDAQVKLDEAEANALKGGKKAMNKMETRIRELQSELEAENRRFSDSQKNLRKSERKTYKKQIEEAEEIAALNLAKFRQTQAQLQESEERADLNEQAFAKYKIKGRAGSMAPM